MSDQFVEAYKPTPAEILRSWADRIEKNAHADFSGAFVILPPKGETIASLFIDPDQDLNTFFALVKSKIDTAVDSLNDAQRNGQRGAFR